MRTLRFAPLRIAGSTVHIAFEVSPATPLYRSTEFKVDFPADLDLERVPQALWWRMVLLCCHAHWPYLRPCRIHLPTGLPPHEVEVWLRLLDSYVVTLEHLRQGRATSRTIEIEARGPLGEPCVALPDAGRAGAAFSAGKDSLLHAGLLRELLPEPPLLVTTTSPLTDSLQDQQTERRRQILDAFAARDDFDWVEVRSDWRGLWKNDFPPAVGYPVAVSETSDTLVYLAFLMIVAWCRGTTHLFVASEAEVQENIEVDRRIVQHPHFMYSAVTQRAIAVLLRPFGFRFGSLAWGLPSAFLTRLLWQRYPDLVEHQYSCWRVVPGEKACNRCTQCFRLAWLAISAGGDPARAGFDLARLLEVFPRWPMPDSTPRGGSPTDRVRHALAVPTARAIGSAPLGALAAAAMRPVGGNRGAGRGLHTLARALSLRFRFRSARAWPWPTWNRQVVGWTDPLLREGLERILGTYSPPGNDPRVQDNADRTERLLRQILAPLEDPRPAMTASTETPAA